MILTDETKGLVAMEQRAATDEQKRRTLLEDLDRRRGAGDRSITLQELLCARHKWCEAHRFLLEARRALNRVKGRGQTTFRLAWTKPQLNKRVAL